VAAAVTVEVYVPGVSPAALMPKDREPVAAEGNTSQLELADLVSVTDGLPVLAANVEAWLATEPFCITE